MKTLISIILFLSLAFCSAQNSQQPIKITINTTPDEIIIEMNSAADSLIQCKVILTDDDKKTIKSIELPDAAFHVLNTINIQTLPPGNYKITVYRKGKKLKQTKFFKDAVFAEPLPEPHTKNN